MLIGSSASFAERAWEIRGELGTGRFSCALIFTLQLGDDRSRWARNLYTKSRISQGPFFFFCIVGFYTFLMRWLLTSDSAFSRTFSFARIIEIVVWGDGFFYFLESSGKLETGGFSLEREDWVFYDEACIFFKYNTENIFFYFLISFIFLSFLLSSVRPYKIN